MFASRLKELRSRRGYTLEELAALVGRSKSQVARWERGQIPASDVVTNLATTFGVSADFLLGLVDQPNGYLQETALSSDEQQLLDALRNGKLRAAMQLVIEMAGDANGVREG